MLRRRRLSLWAVAGHQQSKQQATAAGQQATMQNQEQAAEIQSMQQQIDSMQAPAAPDAAPAGDDMMAQLQQLAQLKNAGVLDDAEFSAAKAKLLGI